MSVLTLPICRQTVQLIESHCEKLDDLASKIRLDEATGHIKISGFELEKLVVKKSDVPDNPRLPILDRSSI